MRDQTGRQSGHADTAKSDSDALQARYDSLYRAFLGLSHEISNSLTLAGGFAELIRIERHLPLTARESLNQLQAAIDHAKEILQDAYHQTSMQLSAVNPARIEFVEFLQQLEAVLAPTLPPLTTLTVESGNAPIGFRAVHAHLRQILFNLISNATRAGARSVHISAASDMTRQSKDEDRVVLQLTVKDDGHGIRAEHLPQIFQPHFSAYGNTAGSGMGLPIVKALAERYDGSAQITSDGSSGTTATITLVSQQ